METYQNERYIFTLALSTKHFQLFVVGIIFFASLGTVSAYEADEDIVCDYDSDECWVYVEEMPAFLPCWIDYYDYDLACHPNTNGYSPLFLERPEVKINCLDALKDNWLLGYCSKELGTL